MHKLSNFNYAIEIWLFMKRILGQMNECWTWNQETWLQNPTTNYLLYLDKRLDLSLKSASPFLKLRQEDHTPETEAETLGGGPAVDASISPLSGWFWWILKFKNIGAQFPMLIVHTKRVLLENFVCVWLQFWSPRQPAAYMKTIPVYSKVLESVMKS